MIDFKLHLPDLSNRHATLVVRSRCAAVGESGPETVEYAAIQRLHRDSLQLPLRGTERDVERLGKELFNTFFPGTIRDSFHAALARANDGLRIVLVFPREITPESTSLLHDLAWETLRSDDRPYGRTSQTPIVRYLEQTGPVPISSVEPPARLLLTTCSKGAPGSPDLDLESQIETIQALCDADMWRGSEPFELEVLEDPTFEEFSNCYLRAKNRRPFHVWHHCGYSSMDRDVFRLAFKDVADSVDWRPARHLNRFIADGGALRLALLNTCHAGNQRGLASSLAGLEVPMTIGYSSAISVPAAHDLVRAFYLALPTVPVDVATNQARESLSRDEDPVEWTKVRMFSRTREALPLLALSGNDAPTPDPNLRVRIKEIARHFNADVRGTGTTEAEIDKVGLDFNLWT